MVEVTLYSLGLDTNQKKTVLLLKDELGRTVPIWIETFEAIVISAGINGGDSLCPRTHTLLLDTLEAVGGRLVRIEIVDFDKGEFCVELVLSMPDKTIRIDCCPSDAIALAIRAECSIYIADIVFDVLENALFSTPEAVIKTEDAQKWAEELEQYTVTNTRYKM